MSGPCHETDMPGRLDDVCCRGRTDMPLKRHTSTSSRKFSGADWLMCRPIRSPGAGPLLHLTDVKASANDRFARRVQLVAATHSANLSAGV